MRPVRCQWYDDDGKPIQNECHSGENCNWVHPDKPDWKIAIRQRKIVPRGRGRGRGRGSGSYNSRDDRYAEKKSDNGWDTSLWKKKPVTNVDWPMPLPMASDKGKGKSNEGWPESSNEKKNDDNGGWGSSGWGDSAGWGTSTGWGDPENEASGGGNLNAPNELEHKDPPAFRPPLQVNTDNPQRANSVSVSEPMVSATPRSAFPKAKKFKIESMSRDQIHQEIIKGAVRVFHIRLELFNIERRLAQWKTNQHSAQFGRISQKTGDRLNGIGGIIATEQAKAIGRLASAEATLLGFPELPTAPPINVKQIDQEMMAYTEQLDIWLRQFALSVAPDQQAPPPPTAAGDMADAPPPLHERVNKQLDKLESSIDDTENTYDAWLTEFNHEFYAGRVLAALAAEPAEQGPMSDLETQAANTKTKLELAATDVVLLTEKSEDVKARVGHLELEYDKYQKLEQTMAAKLSQVEEKQRLRREKKARFIEELAQYSQNPAPATLDPAISARATEIVDAMIQNEVNPAVQALGIQYSEAIRRRMSSLDQSLEPAMEQTVAMSRLAMRLYGSGAREAVG
ncbi:hypothetical protein C8F01DRAFT_1107529 [Mycena amicta]|nr:hypothetical protein C8F01DRAFT_1107529 [Mycena amicta]